MVCIERMTPSHVLQGDKQPLLVVNMYTSGRLNAFFDQVGVLMPGLAKFAVDVANIACFFVLQDTFSFRPVPLALCRHGFHMQCRDGGRLLHR
ncbi:Uncharacterised protein [Salmonella enterica]|nr:Uncharacterised protein [Salmonella enterica]